MTQPRRDPLRPGQESVWDYPRPPALRACTLPIEVLFAGRRVCRTTTSWQVLETSHPPTSYLPLEAFADGVLQPGTGSSWCEWKGAARYLDLMVGERTAAGAAWTYPHPRAGYEALVGHVALYAAATDGCFVDGERVRPQPGGFYGGWITAAVAGPFKGEPGSRGW